MDALILVDLQNDFMPGGALAVDEGDAVVPVANRLMHMFQARVATRDWHPRNHGSFVTAHPDHHVGDLVTLGGLDQVVWPVHCVQETHGAAFHEHLDTDALTRIIPKGTDPGIDSYSGFFDNGHRKATDLENVLRHLGVERVFVMGLATDYCVKFTVLDAVELGFDTVVIRDGCRAVNLKPDDGERALAEMAEAGARISTADQVAAELPGDG